MAIATGIGAGLTGLMGIGQSIAGGIQAKRGRRDLKELEQNRPTYTRPEEVNQSGRIARLRASNPFLPGQELMEQGVRGTTAQTVQNIKDMGGVGDLYMAQINENKSLNEIGVQSAQQTLQNELNLIKQLESEADYTDKEFDFNQNIPFQEKRQDALSRIGAGMQNLFGGLGTIAKSGTGFMGMEGKEGFTQYSENETTGSEGGIDIDTGASMESLLSRIPVPRISVPRIPNRLQRIKNLYNF